MHYSISLYHFSSSDGPILEISDIPTRYDLAMQLDALLKRYPKHAEYEYSITGTVCTRYTLLDSDIQSGEQASAALWDFMHKENAAL